MKFQIIIFTILIFTLFLTDFSSAKEEAPTIRMPETLEEAWKMLGRFWEVSKEKLPEIFKGLWKNEVLPLWKKMFEWFRVRVWGEIKSWFIRKIWPRVEKETEKRKTILREELEKEKEKTTEEIRKSLWERFKELIK